MMPGQVSDFWGFEPPILAVVPATLPLSYALKPSPMHLSFTRGHLPSEFVFNRTPHASWPYLES